MEAEIAAMEIYVGAPIEYESERSVLRKIERLLTDDRRSAIVFANISINSRQIDFVLALNGLVLVIEAKGSSRPVRGGENGPPSSFARELAGDGYDVTVFGRPPGGDVLCPVCVEGRLTRRENRQSGSLFYGCSNYPYCEHRQRPCPECGKGLVVKADGGFRCRDCGHAIASCPQCSGWLQTRMGRYGRFLGCTNFPACGYTRDLRQEPPRSRTAARNFDPGRRITR